MLGFTAGLLFGCASDLSAPPGNDSAYRVVILPDTQCYSLYYPDILEAQGRWILDHIEDLDIRAVIHLGDVTENNIPEQWAVAQRALSPLRSRLPLAMAPGNHDLGPDGTAQDRSSLIEAHFPLDRTAPGFAGTFDGTSANTAWTFRGQRYEYVVVALEFAPRPAARQWARELLAVHRRAIAIVSTHAYLDAGGRRYDHRADPMQPFCPYEYGVAEAGASDGEELWQELIAPTSNTRLVTSGHVPNGFAASVDVNDAGFEVQQVMVDYQTGTRCPETGGDGRGYLLVLELRESDDAIRVHARAYSPWEDRFRNEHELRFNLAPPPR